MRKWEYLDIIARYPAGNAPYVASINGKKQKEDIFLYDFLKEIGFQGWELVTAAAITTDSSYRLYFKRPLEE